VNYRAFGFAVAVRGDSGQKWGSVEKVEPGSGAIIVVRQDWLEVSGHSRRPKFCFSKQLPNPGKDSAIALQNPGICVFWECVCVKIMPLTYFLPEPRS
jgi:hypothetical protein